MTIYPLVEKIDYYPILIIVEKSMQKAKSPDF